MTNIATLKITCCDQCPYHSSRREPTADIFELVMGWYCTRKDVVVKKQALTPNVFVGFEEDGQKPGIPDWCPIIVTKDKEECHV